MNQERYQKIINQIRELEYGYRDGYSWHGESEDGKHYDPKRDMTLKSKSA